MTKANGILPLISAIEGVLNSDCVVGSKSCCSCCDAALGVNDEILSSRGWLVG